MNNQTPDTKPGFYYVSAIDGEKFALMLGPFETHEQALAKVEECRNLAYDLHPASHWWLWGTCRKDDGAKLGRMNETMGI